MDSTINETPELSIELEEFAEAAGYGTMMGD